MNLSYSDYLFMVDMWLKYKKRHNIHIKWKACKPSCCVKAKS